MGAKFHLTEDLVADCSRNYEIPLDSDVEYVSIWTNCCVCVCLRNYKILKHLYSRYIVLEGTHKGTYENIQS